MVCLVKDDLLAGLPFFVVQHPLAQSVHSYISFLMDSSCNILSTFTTSAATINSDLLEGCYSRLLVREKKNVFCLVHSPEQDIRLCLMHIPLTSEASVLPLCPNLTGLMHL